MFADVRDVHGIAYLESQFLSKFEIVRKEDIKAKVLQAQDKSVALKKDILRNKLPRFISWFLEDKISYKGSEIYDELKNDDVTYVTYALRKLL